MRHLGTVTLLLFFCRITGHIEWNSTSSTGDRVILIVLSFLSWSDIYKGLCDMVYVQTRNSQLYERHTSFSWWSLDHIALRGVATFCTLHLSQRSPQQPCMGELHEWWRSSILKMMLWLLTFLWVDCFEKLRKSITLLGLIYLTKSLPGEEAFADK